MNQRMAVNVNPRQESEFPLQRREIGRIDEENVRPENLKRIDGISKTNANELNLLEQSGHYHQSMNLSPISQVERSNRVDRFQWLLQSADVEEFRELYRDIKLPDAKAMADLIRNTIAEPKIKDFELVSQIVDQAIPLGCEDSIQLQPRRRLQFAWENFDKMIFDCKDENLK